MSSSELNHEPDLLIIGGDIDPNIIRLSLKAGERGLAYHSCLQGDSGTPEIIFNAQTNTLSCDNKILKPKSAFIRHDVFKYMSDNNPQTLQNSTDWFHVFYGWLMANEDIKILNRQSINKPYVNKLATLIIAKNAGLNIPDTYITNTVSFINQVIFDGQWIQKPVDGGAQCTELSALPAQNYPHNRIARPLIMQPRLEYPELRVYRIKNNIFAYKVMSADLDYRESKSSHIMRTEISADLSEPLIKLCDQLGLDYCATDFKTCPKTGKFLLLEVNSNPMFATYDSIAKGDLISLILDALTN